MDPNEVAALITLAEQGVVAALALYKKLTANQSGAKTLAQLEADTDAQLQSVIDNSSK